MYIRSHIDIPKNDHIDFLAKTATQQIPTSFVTIKHKSQLIRKLAHLNQKNK